MHVYVNGQNVMVHSDVLVFALNKHRKPLTQQFLNDNGLFLPFIFIINGKYVFVSSKYSLPKQEDASSTPCNSHLLLVSPTSILYLGLYLGWTIRWNVCALEVVYCIKNYLHIHCHLFTL